MAVKGIGVVVDIAWEGTETFNIQVRYMAFGESEIAGQINIVELSSTISSATFEATVKAALKSHLINAHSVSFGLLDTVRLIGATI